MKQSILCIAMALLTGSLMAAPKDDVQAAIKKLGDGGNYSWTERTENAGGGRGFGGGPMQGKITKDGVAWLSSTITFNENTTTTEAFAKGGDKGAVKGQDGNWQSLEELAAGGQGGGRRGGRGGFGAAGRARNFKAPAVQAEELLGKVKEVKMADGAYSGDLPADAVAPLLTFGGGRGRGGEAPPPPANAKGSIKYWVKDGALSKYELKVQGTLSFGDNSFEVDRTTTVEFKDVGSTKVEVPEDAKKKLM